jgi:hypothetical protein
MLSSAPIVDALPDGDCAYNAFALALCEQAVLKKLTADCISPNTPDVLYAKFIKKVSDSKEFKDKVRDSKSVNWAVITSFLAKLRESDKKGLQQFLAPLLRELSIDLIKPDNKEAPYLAREHKNQTYPRLRDEFSNFLNCKATGRPTSLANIGDMFFTHTFIKEKFDELFDEKPILTNVEKEKKLLNWWKDTGHSLFLTTMKQPSRGNTERYAGDLELGVLAEYFQLNCGIIKQGKPSSSMGYGYGLIPIKKDLKDGYDLLTKQLKLEDEKKVSPYSYADHLSARGIIIKHKLDDPTKTKPFYEVDKPKKEHHYELTDLDRNAVEKRLKEIPDRDKAFLKMHSLASSTDATISVIPIAGLILDTTGLSQECMDQLMARGIIVRRADNYCMSVGLNTAMERMGGITIDAALTAFLNEWEKQYKSPVKINLYQTGGHWQAYKYLAPSATHTISSVSTTTVTPPATPTSITPPPTPPSTVSSSPPKKSTILSPASVSGSTSTTSTTLSPIPTLIPTPIPTPTPTPTPAPTSGSSASALSPTIPPTFSGVSAGIIPPITITPSLVITPTPTPTTTSTYASATILPTPIPVSSASTPTTSPLPLSTPPSSTSTVGSTSSIPSSITPSALRTSPTLSRAASGADLIVRSPAITSEKKEAYKEAEATLRDVAKKWASVLIDEKHGANPLLIKPIKDWSRKKGSAMATSEIKDKLNLAIQKAPTELNISETAIIRTIIDEKTSAPISSLGSATGACNKNYLQPGTAAECKIIAPNASNGGTFKEVLVGGLLKVIPDNIPPSTSRLHDDGINIVPSLAKLQYVDAMFKPFLSNANLSNQPLLIRGHKDVEYVRAVILLCAAYGLKVNYENSRQPSDILANYVPTTVEVNIVKQQIAKGNLTPIQFEKDARLLSTELKNLQDVRAKIAALPDDPKRAVILTALDKAGNIIDETRKGNVTGDTVKEFENIIPARRR